MARTVPINLRLTEQEAAQIEKTREEMQVSIGDPNGLKITSAQAARQMMFFRSDRHLTRLRDIPSHVFQSDLYELLRHSKWDGAERAAMHLALFDAHRKLRKEHAEQLGVKTSDI